MSYLNNNDNRIFQYFNKKNYKEKINFNIWLKHYEPFLEDIFYDFIYLCENNNIKLFINDNTKTEFYKMLYNTSSGILVDKWDFPYLYGLIKEEDEDINIKNQEEENIKEKKNHYSDNKNIDDDRFPSRL